MIRYVITGASGWLGQNVLDALLNGSSDFDVGQLLAPAESLRCLALPGERLSPSLRTPQVEWVEGDLASGAGLDRLFAGTSGVTLIHLAGLIHPKLLVRDFAAVNTDGTRKVIEAATAAGIAKAVVMSSNSPIGCNPAREHQFSETSPYNPYMGYGHSKHLMELHLRQLMDSDNGFPICIIRAPWFYGPHQPVRQKLFFEMIRDGKGPLVGDGSNRRSMAYVGNLAQGILLAALKPAADNEIFWIADERPYPMTEILDVVERLLEQEFNQRCVHKRMRLPALAADVAYAIDGTLQACGLYHQKIHVLSEMNKTIACSVDKAKAVLGYRPTVALEEGMRRSLRELFAH
jgi:nucleoside-diphosphate-sugar epimerase